MWNITPPSLMSTPTINSFSTGTLMSMQPIISYKYKPPQRREQNSDKQTKTTNKTGYGATAGNTEDV